MNDGMYTNIRNYLEEIAGQQKQILAAVQRTNELLEREPPIAKQVNAAMVQTLEDIASAPEPTDKPKTATKKSKPKPAVNWNS